MFGLGGSLVSLLDSNFLDMSTSLRTETSNVKVLLLQDLAICLEVLSCQVLGISDGVIGDWLIRVQIISGLGEGHCPPKLLILITIQLCAQVNNFTGSNDVIARYVYSDL